MDRKALQSYATWSKQYLEQQIELSLKALGIHSDDDIREAKRVGDVTIIDGDATSYPAGLLNQRNSIVRMIKNSGYQNTVEAFAYTWFNRLIALRFMEIHDFMPHGFRVLSDRSGGVEPEIMRNLNFVSSELSLDMSLCAELKEKNDVEGLFRYVLFKQCNALSDMLPMLFDKEDAYLELLLPKSLLRGDTVITKLRDIPEETFLDDIEVIGWLYQYYISSKKDKVFSDLKNNIKISAENIPAATQLFTPDWIVRYMVENSLGRVWMESYPNSSIKNSMDYYVDERIQDDSVIRVLENIKYKNINPEDLRILEPCCGSGHILVYMFDLLFKMYEEKGYMAREIPTLILSKNLFGLEIDKRASQIASFALVMRARSINNRFFDKQYYVRPNVFELYESKELIEMDYRKQLLETHLTEKEKHSITQLVDCFEEAKTLGSLIFASGLDFDLLEKAEAALKKEVVTTFNVQLLTDGQKLISKLIAQARVFACRYDVVVTNPPYMEISSGTNTLVGYVNQHFIGGKTDLFATFIERAALFAKPNGFVGMITQPSLTSLVSFEKLRIKIFTEKTIYNFLHMGRGIFGIDFGSVSFVYRNTHIKEYNANFFKLYERTFQFINLDDIRKIFLLAKENDAYTVDFDLYDTSTGINNIQSETGNQLSFIAKPDNFMLVPGTPFAYAMSEKMIKAYSFGVLGDSFVTREGMATAGNDDFLRLWHEVNHRRIGFGFSDAFEAEKSKLKWFPYNKGGDYRKWYGNNDYVVDWENDGFRIRNNKDPKTGRIRSHNYNGDFAFKEGLTWSSISAGDISIRWSESGFLFDSKGAKGFSDSKRKMLSIMGLLNSSTAMKYLKVISPTMDFKVGDLIQLPLNKALFDSDELVDRTKRNIDLLKRDWNSRETSWEFEGFPIGECNTLSQVIEKYINDKHSDRQELKTNEERINSIVADIYHLEKETKITVSEDKLSISESSSNTAIREFISYLVGIIMGRYSLDVSGLAYAGGEWDPSKYKTYQPDDDGIVPIYAGVGMEDGLTGRIVELIKLIFGEETLRENMDYLAESLGKNSNESSVETLNRYLNDTKKGFYSVHKKTYQNRPIYWLFSSGDNKGFKCLVYLHRYSKDTLARINAKYYLPESTRQKIELEDLDKQIKTAEGKERIRLEKSRTKLFDKYNETIEYGQVLDHMANKYIEIDLDDGVKINYAKFQGVELVSDSGMKIKKDLLVPLK